MTSPKTQTTEDPAYSGTDTLELLEDAHNYNGYLLKQVLKRTPHGGRVLDFGAGIGTFAARVHEQGHDVTCVEMDPDNCARIKERGLPAATNSASLPSGQFDLIYSLNVLEHIEDDLGALRDLHRLLKQDGTLVLYVPAFMVLYSNFDARIGHLRRYTRASLTGVATRAGFSVRDARYQDSLGFPTALLYRFFGPRDGSVSRSMALVYDRFVFPVSRLLDRVFHRLVGKNVLLEGRRRELA